VIPGSTESTTVGNFAIQLAALDGNYSDDIGVSGNAVAKWASVLAAQPITPETEIRAHRVDGTQGDIGEAST
jgi:hypothetical protein